MSRTATLSTQSGGSAGAARSARLSRSIELERKGKDVADHHLNKLDRHQYRAVIDNPSKGVKGKRVRGE
jgi:hypothetical protein